MNRRKHKGRNEEEKVDESWLIPYADILTLLLALFIVLFAMGDINENRFVQVAQSFNVAFSGGSNVFDYPSPVVPQYTGPDPLETPLDEQTIEYQRETEQLNELGTKLNRYIEENNLASSLEADVTDRGLIITIKDRVLFNSGSAVVSADGLTLANKISVLLEETQPRQISIAGHTDNVPINTREFPSNWELSAKRALNFMHVLLENENLDPSSFSATGYGEYRPIDTNNTPEGKANNRRVEISIERLFKN